MKKILFLLLFLPFLLKGDFIEEMQSIDLLLQKGQYQEAYNRGEKLYQSNISEEDKESLKNLLDKIQQKIKEGSSNENVSNNTGDINFVTEEGLESLSDGTLSFPGDEINDASKYKEYSQLESQVLASKNSDNINSLLKIYVKAGLYEKAMNLGMKDTDVRNIYISAYMARLIGKNDIAIKQYKKVLSNNPNHLNSLLGLGLAYRSKKDNSNAIKYLNQYLNKGGNNPNVAATIKYLGK